MIFNSFSNQSATRAIDEFVINYKVVFVCPEMVISNKCNDCIF